MRGAIQVGEVADSDHIITELLASGHKYKLVSRHSDHDRMTAGML